MALDATYDSVLSRVRLTTTLLGASATYAVFDRTTDALNYTTVRGGSHVAVASQVAAVTDDFEFPVGVATTYRVRSYNSSDVLQQTFTDAITQDLTSVWFKSFPFAFLNQAQKITDVGSITRTNRSGVFPIMGRSVPVVVSEVRGSRKINLQVNTITDDQRDDFDYLLATGDPVFIQAPLSNVIVPTGYFTIDDYSEVLVGIPSVQRFFNLSLTEVAAPTDDITPVTMTWNGLVNRYPTWADVIAANASWNAVLALVGEPSDVVIP